MDSIHRTPFVIGDRRFTSTLTMFNGDTILSSDENTFAQCRHRLWRESEARSSPVCVCACRPPFAEGAPVPYPDESSFVITLQL
ncbi:hypothetical protein EVAR_92698_1 [Eumeta japonica]|uniref:Uncharacterized protein n=1 Tax=Eumeta variegata TaxID=151549 RepID=A0A4C1SXW8_EUMVA|nr:hypothetical protein EVAR_92698_1 [Eumeta japonica]